MSELYLFVTVTIVIEYTVVVGQTLQQAAEELIGRSVFVGWPHLYEALVESVADEEMGWVLHFDTFSRFITVMTVIEKHTFV